MSKRKSVVAVLSLAAVSLVALTGAQSMSAGKLAPTAACANYVDHEPVVVFDVTGHTIATSVHSRFTLYDDGRATLSKFTDVGGGIETGEARTTVVATQAVDDLLQDLAAAGAFTLCDQKQIAVDVPLSTLTVLRGQTDARAHSFSYWTATGAHAAAGTAIAQFIAATFPGF